MQTDENRRLRLAIAVAFLAAGVALVLWWRSGEDAERRVSTPLSDAQEPADLVAPPVAPPPRPGDAAEPAPVRLFSAEVHAVAPTAVGAIEGKVVNWGSGTGVAGADVVFSFAQTTASVTTDGDGEFAWTPPDEGVYELAIVVADGYLPYAPNLGDSSISVVARRGLSITGISVYLTPAIDYRGTVVDPAGNPVAGARVELLGVASGERELVPIRTEYKSDAAGRFVFNAPDGTVLQASHPGFADGRAQLDDRAQVSHELAIPLRPNGATALGAQTVAGRVVSTDGQPVAGARVFAVRAAADSVRSDADGRFELIGLDPGGLAVTASHDDYATTSVFAKAGARDVVVELAPGAVVRGRVVDGAGEPVPAFTIVVTVERGMRSTVVAQRSVFDAQGRFDVGGLERREHMVAALAHGHAPSAPVAVDAEAPADARDIQLVLAGGGRITGRVTDAETSQPLAKARVSLDSMIGGGGTSAVPLSVSVVTADDGSFELDGVASGMRSVTVAAYQHHLRIVSGLQIEDGRTVGPLDIRLSPTAVGEEPKVEVAGIGVAIAPGDDGLIINSVIPTGGAAEAGLVEGDVILRVEADLVMDLGFEGALQRIRGPEGTPVRLTVRRPTGKVSEVVAYRRRIRV